MNNLRELSKLAYKLLEMYKEVDEVRIYENERYGGYTTEEQAVEEQEALNELHTNSLEQIKLLAGLSDEDLMTFEDELWPQEEGDG